MMMETLILAILLFALGAVLDFMVTVFYFTVKHNRAYLGSGLSGVMAWLTMAGFYKLMEQTPSDAWGLISAYALGCTLGTWLSFKVDKVLQNAA